MAYAKEGVCKGHTCHGGSICHMVTGLHIISVLIGLRQIPEYLLHGLDGECVSIRSSHHGSIGLQCMCHGIDTGCAGQSSGLGHHVVGIYDGQLGMSS